MCSIPFLAHLRGGRCYNTSSGTCTTAGNHEYNVCPFLPLCPVGEQLKGGRGASFHTVILCISLLSLFLLRFGNFLLPLQFVRKRWLAHDTWLTVVLSFAPCHYRNRFAVTALLTMLGYQPAFTDHLCACRFAVVILSISPSSPLFFFNFFLSFWHRTQPPLYFK